MARTQSESQGDCLQAAFRESYFVNFHSFHNYTLDNPPRAEVSLELLASAKLRDLPRQFLERYVNGELSSHFIAGEGAENYRFLSRFQCALVEEGFGDKNDKVFYRYRFEVPGVKQQPIGRISHEIEEVIYRLPKWIKDFKQKTRNFNVVVPHLYKKQARAPSYVPDAAVA